MSNAEQKVWVEWYHLPVLNLLLHAEKMQKESLLQSNSEWPRSSFRQQWHQLPVLLQGPTSDHLGNLHHLSACFLQAFCQAMYRHQNYVSFGSTSSAGVILLSKSQCLCCPHPNMLLCFSQRWKWAALKGQDGFALMLSSWFHEVKIS